MATFRHATAGTLPFDSRGQKPSDHPDRRRGSKRLQGDRESDRPVRPLLTSSGHIRPFRLCHHVIERGGEQDRGGARQLAVGRRYGLNRLSVRRKASRRSQPVGDLREAVHVGVQPQPPLRLKVAAVPQAGDGRQVMGSDRRHRHRRPLAGVVFFEPEQPVRKNVVVSKGISERLLNGAQVLADYDGFERDGFRGPR